MIIAHNLEAMNSMRNSNSIRKSLLKSSEKLSTGYKINRSADNSAGLQISEKMRAQIRGLGQASTNAQDGISFIQTMDGALDNVQALVQRGRELSVQAANDTSVESDRLALQEEINNINNEITRIGEQTQFNNINCFPTSGMSPVMMNTIHDVAVYNIHINPTTGITEVSMSGATGNILYDKIATELMPNAVHQILDAFPSLSTGETDIPLKLEIGNIDGANSTLAYAQISYFPSTGDIVSFTLKVDSSDFDDADAEGTGANAEMLESTIAHEMMHHIMYNALTDGMTDYGPDDFPTWFTEGTAQIVGGGFTTGWNNTLTAIENNGLLDEATKLQKVTDYLKSYTPSSRPYGHGYLATAYLGHLASGNPASAVTPDSIRIGLNNIFTSIRSGKTLDQAISDNTSYVNTTAINNAFATPDITLLNVVRTLAQADGAGSVITDSFSTGGIDILKNITNPAKVVFVISDATIPVPPGATIDTSYLNLQVGANSGQSIGLNLYNISTDNLGINGANVLNHVAASNSIEQYSNASEKISVVRSYYGAMQNRLEHTISNLDNSAENLQAAESRIRDTDIAKEMVAYSKNSILEQVTHSILAQANQNKQGVLSLLN